MAKKEKFDSHHKFAPSSFVDLGRGHFRPFPFSVPIVWSGNEAWYCRSMVTLTKQSIRGHPPKRLSHTILCPDNLLPLLSTKDRKIDKFTKNLFLNAELCQIWYGSREGKLENFVLEDMEWIIVLNSLKRTTQVPLQKIKTIKEDRNFSISKPPFDTKQQEWVMKACRQINKNYPP